MTRLAAISKERHTGKSWSRASTFSFTATTSRVPLGAREVPVAAMNMPLAFILGKEEFILVGLLSFSPGRNLLLGPDGKLLTDYVPAVFRSYPFRLVKASGNKPGMVLCVDEASGLVMENGGEETFFDENGELSKPVLEIFESLKQAEQSRLVLQHGVSALAKAELIAPWEIQAIEGGQEKAVTGIFTIDEEKLNKLDDDAFVALRKAHALPIAYSQLLSRANIRVLQNLSRVHDEARPPQDVDLDGFSLVDDSMKL
jgi:hypothetical protein